MKILSTFKDYYDFMVSKYGVDTKIIYNRVPEEKESVGWRKTGMYKPPHMGYPESVEEYVIHFCGKMFFVYYVFGDWFFGDGILDAEPEKYPEVIPNFYAPYEQKYSLNTRNTTAVIKHWQAQYKPKEKGRYWALPDDTRVTHGSPSKRNDELKCPVVLGDHKDVRLSDFNFGKIVSPNEAFITISNWLSREKEVIDKQSDKEKIVSHGFDVKTSFRKM